MKTFKNYFKIIYANKFSLIIYIALFLILLNINNASNEESLNINYNISVIDNANNEESKKLINFLESKYTVTKEKLTDDEAKDKLFSGMVAYVLFIKDNNNLSYIAKEDSIVPSAINLSINEYLNTSRTLEKYNIANSNEETVNLLSENIDFKILNSSQRDNTDFYYNYLAYVIILFSLSTIYLGYNAFLRNGVENRIRVSKTRFNKFIISIYMSSLLFMFLICIGFAIIELLKNGTNIKQFFLYTINLLFFSMSMVALAYLISSKSKDSHNNGALNNIISLSLCFITGIFVPQEFLPEYLLKFSSLFPPYWYLEGIKSAGKYNYSIFLKVILIQLSMTIVIILINAVLNKNKNGEFSYSR